MLRIKPLSVNKAYANKKNIRRHKSQEYLIYISNMMLVLPPNIYIPKGEMKVHILFNFSSKGADIDNCVKPFLDILQKKYGFNDNRIYKIEVTKNVVKKGDESIVFYIDDYVKEVGYIDWLIKRCGEYYAND